MMSLTVLLFLVTLIGGSLSQSCAPPISSTDLLQSGKTSFVRSNPAQTRQHCFTVNADYQMPSTRAEVAVSTSSIGGYSPPGVDYTIRGSRKGGTNSVILSLFITDDNRWTSITASYLISSRTDIIMGNFVAIPIGVSRCNINNDNGKESVDTYVPTWRFTSGKTYRVAAFISGIRTEASYFSLSIVQSVVQSATGRIVVQYQTNANPSLEFIQFTYVVYPTQHDSFTLAYNGNPSAQGTYNLQGISNFNQQTIKYEELIICKVGAGCAPTEILSGNQCVCRPGLIKVSGSCWNICASNAYFNDRRQCVCIPGYTRNSNGQCTDSQTPICPPNQRPTTAFGNCACVDGFYRSNQGTCVANCPLPNQIWNGRACQCDTGFFQISTGACVPNFQCQPNEQNVNGQCVCAAGYYRDQNQVCVIIPQCSQNQTLSGNQCICKNGYTRISGVCVIPPTCSSIQVYNPTRNRCDCAEGYQEIAAGQCITICGANQVYNSTTKRCDCASGFTLVSGRCIRQTECLPNQTFNPLLGRCQCVNGFTQVGALCIKNCGANEILNTTSQRCECANGYTQNQFGQCIKVPNCLPGQTFNQASGNCECLPGYVNLGGQCINPCAVNQQIVNGRCQCRSGFVFISNACRQCPPGSSPSQDQTTCICSSPSQIFNISKLLCEGCPANSSPSNDKTTCTCNSGFQQSSSGCVQSVNCPLNSQFDQSTLTCTCVIPGQYLISGVCRTCSNNEEWNGTACACVSKYYRIAGVCRTCDINTNYNGQDCFCNRGYFGTRDKCDACHNTCGTCFGNAANQCTSCLDITYTLSGGYCTRGTGPCPIGTYLEGTSCQGCSEYCKSCTSLNSCQSCSDGFQLSSINLGGQTLSACMSICGDGRRVDTEECDDTNTINGDGCNSDCQVEIGWTCSVGTSTARSICSTETPNSSVILIRGAVNLIGKTVLGIRLSYMPACVTQDGCLICSQLLDVRVISSQVANLAVKVIYVPKNIGQFLVEFDTGAVITNHLFTYSVQLNRDLPAQYRNCFTEADYAQQIIQSVDTSLLSRAGVETLLPSQQLLQPGELALQQP